jgi:hypothetical protein
VFAPQWVSSSRFAFQNPDPENNDATNVVTFSRIRMLVTEDKSQQSPAYYPLAISLGVDQSKARKDLQRLVDLSLQDFPEYYPLHRAMLRALLPKWGGSYVEIDDYIEHVQDKVPADRRREMYARLYTTLAALEGDEVDTPSRCATSA